MIYFIKEALHGPSMRWMEKKKYTKNIGCGGKRERHPRPSQAQEALN